MAEIKQAFEQRVIAIPVEQILPSRKVDHLMLGSKKIRLYFELDKRARRD